MLVLVAGCERTVTVVTGSAAGMGGAHSSVTIASATTTAASTAANTSTGAGTEASGGNPNGVCANTISAMYGTGLLSPGMAGSTAASGGCETNQAGHATDPQCCDCIVCARQKYCGGKLTAFRNHPESAPWTACVFPDMNGMGGCPKTGFQACVDACNMAHPGAQAAYVALLNCAVCETCAYNCNAYGELGNCGSVPLF
jgi:hypothetical protein